MGRPGGHVAWGVHSREAAAAAAVGLAWLCRAVLGDQVGLRGCHVHHPCAIDADQNKCRPRVDGGCPAAVPLPSLPLTSGFRETILFHIQTRPKFTGTALHEVRAAVVLGSTWERVQHASQSLAWRAFEAASRVGAVGRPWHAWQHPRLLHQLLLQLTPHRADRGRVQCRRGCAVPRGPWCWC